MIKIKVKDESNFISSIKVLGHANYDEYGKDIVCAAVSSVVLTSVNAILRFNDDAILYDEKDGYVSIEVKSRDEVTQELLLNMLMMLEDLVSEYPKYISIRNEGKK